MDGITAEAKFPSQDQKSVHTYLYLSPFHQQNASARAWLGYILSRVNICVSQAPLLKLMNEYRVRARAHFLSVPGVHFHPINPTSCWPNGQPDKKVCACRPMRRCDLLSVYQSDSPKGKDLCFQVKELFKAGAQVYLIRLVSSE